MTSSEEQEYRQLSLESSNLLMERDGRWTLGQYAESTLAGRRAGDLRQRMGQLHYQSGGFIEATEDWLSAAVCYLQANAPAEAQTIVHRVEQLQEQGCIPLRRADLLELLQRRRQEVQNLIEKNGTGIGMEITNGFPAIEAESVGDTE
jgi:hypothetical protein